MSLHLSCMQLSACSAAGEMMCERSYQHRQLQLHDIESLRHAGHEADEAPGEASPQGLSPCPLCPHGTVQPKRRARMNNSGQMLGALPVKEDKAISRQPPP